MSVVSKINTGVISEGKGIFYSALKESINSFPRPGSGQLVALGVLLAVASHLDLVRWYQNLKKNERNEQTDAKIATEEHDQDLQQELERKQEQEHESGSAISIQDNNPEEQQKIDKLEVKNVPESATEIITKQRVQDTQLEKIDTKKRAQKLPKEAKGKRKQKLERRSVARRSPEASEVFRYNLYDTATPPTHVEGRTFHYGSPFHLLLRSITVPEQGISPPRGLANTTGICFVNACLQMIRSSPVLMDAFRVGVTDMMDSCPNQLRIPAVDGMIIFLRYWKYLEPEDLVVPWSIMRYVTHNESKFKYHGNGGHSSFFINVLLSSFDSEFQRYRPWKQPMLDCLSIIRPSEDDCCRHSQSGYMNRVRLSRSIQNQLNAGDPCLKLPRAILVDNVNFMDRNFDDDDYDNHIEETLLLRRDDTRPGWIGYSGVQYQLRSIVLFRPCRPGANDFNHALAAVRSQGTSQLGESLWVLCDDHRIYSPMTLSAVFARESTANPYVLLYERQ